MKADELAVVEEAENISISDICAMLDVEPEVL